MPDDWCEGFVKIYIENQGDESIWFDDISVEHTHNPGKIEVVSYKDYYPFGAEMRGSCIDNQGRYGYQGDYAEQDKETGWNAFELRMYDPLIGRSTSVDPYRQYHSPYMWVGNNPIVYVDKEGGWAQIAIGAGVGGVISAGFEVYKQVSEGNIVYNGGLDIDFKEGALANVGIAFGEGVLTGAAVSSGAVLFGATTLSTTAITYSSLTGGIGAFGAGTVAELARQKINGQEASYSDALQYGAFKGIATGVGTHFGGLLLRNLRADNWGGNLTRSFAEKILYQNPKYVYTISRVVAGTTVGKLGTFSYDGTKDYMYNEFNDFMDKVWPMGGLNQGSDLDLRMHMEDS